MRMPAKRAKYRSKKVTQDGATFDSAKEARRWLELELLARAGRITELKRQVPFVLIPKQRRDDGKAERACSYIADFVYMDNGLKVVEDSKGFSTRDYIIKRKLMLMVHSVSVREV